VIQLHNHSLVFETADGDLIPCDAEEVTVELIGEAVQQLDPNLVQQATAAVLHYFRHERAQEVVTIGEFTAALEEVLRNLGLNVLKGKSPTKGGKILEADLCDLVEVDGSATELLFFTRLRREFGKLLNQSPRMVRLTGLRPCVKHMVGARNWSKRCVRTSDQIVTFLRAVMDHRETGRDCALIVS
jgi:hypothetical protein